MTQAERQQARIDKLVAAMRAVQTVGFNRVDVVKVEEFKSILDKDGRLPRITD